MAEVTYKYSLPEEEDLVDIHHKALKTHANVHEVLRYIRSTLKWGSPSEECEKHLKEIEAILICGP